MKALALLLALAAVNGFKEPSAINPEEEHDEVALAQKRAVWIACLSLTESNVESKLTAFSNKAKAKSVPVDKIVRKFAAESLENCLKSTGLIVAEQYLAGEDTEGVQKFKASVFSILLDQDLDNFELSEAQWGLIGDVASEAGVAEDGFDQIPPIVPEVFNIPDNRNLYIGAGGAAVLILVVLWRSMGSEPSQDKKTDKKAGKKKRD